MKCYDEANDELLAVVVMVAACVDAEVEEVVGAVADEIGRSEIGANWYIRPRRIKHWLSLSLCKK